MNPSLLGPSPVLFLCQASYLGLMVCLSPVGSLGGWLPDTAQPFEIPLPGLEHFLPGNVMSTSQRQESFSWGLLWIELSRKGNMTLYGRGEERGHPSPEDTEGDGGPLLVRPQAGEHTLQLWQRATPASLSGPPAAPRAAAVSCGRWIPSPQP